MNNENKEIAVGLINRAAIMIGLTLIVVACATKCGRGDTDYDRFSELRDSDITTDAEIMLDDYLNPSVSLDERENRKILDAHRIYQDEESGRWMMRNNVE